MKVLIVTMLCDRYNGIAEVSLPNMLEYCQRHSYYDAVIKLSDEEGFHYKKHEFFDEVFKTDVDLIFYKDIDSVITNLTVPIENFVDSEHDVFVTKDMMGYNGGSLIIKNTEGGRWVNDFILSQRDNFNNEQEVMDKYFDEFTKNVKVLSHPSINSYDYSAYSEFPNIRGREEGHWHEGDFLLHTPALTYEHRATILKNAKITR
ncbi:MAG TPA: hypothetical protein VIY47_00570 [Ignavibacteriaceae bacterium]